MSKDLKERLASLFSDVKESLIETGQRQAAALRPGENEALVQSLIDDLPIGYHEIDVEGRITRVNRAELSMLGYTADEMLGRPVWELIVEREAARQAIQARLTGQALLKTTECTYLHKDGRHVSVLMQDRHLLNLNGKIVGMRTTVQDITEHRWAEKIKASEETLQRRAMQFQTAAQVSRAATSILKIDELLPQVVELVRDRFGLYYVGLFLVDDTGQWAVLRAGTGEAGRQMIQAGHKLQVGGSSMIGWCVANGQARIALDVGEEAVRFSNPLLPQTRSEMALPLISRERVIGAMTIQSEQPAAFGPDDITILQTMADQLATAIENARLFQSSQTFAERQAIANEVLQIAVTAETTAQMFEAATQTTSRRLQMPCMILLLDQTGQSLQVQSICGPDGNVLTLETAMVITPDNNPVMFQAIQEQKTQTVWNVSTLSRGTAISIAQRFNIENAAYVPIVGRDQAFGLFVLGQPFGHPRLDADEIAFIEILASQLALGLENRRSLEQVQARAEEMATLNELSRAFSMRLDLSQVLDEVYRGASRLMDTTNFYVALYDAPLNQVVFALDVRGQDVRRMAGRRQAGQGITEHVIHTRAPLLLEDNVPARLQELGIESIGPEAQSWLGVPMMIGDQVLGVIAVQSYTTPRAYNRHHCDLLHAIASQAAVAIQNARLFEETHRRAEEMAVLNDLSRMLSARLELSQVLDEVYRGASRLMDATNFYVALYDAKLDEVSFPLYAEGDRIRPLARRRRSGKGLTEYIIRTRTPLLIPENIPARLQELGVESIGQEAQSWLGVPMTIGDQVLGVLAVQSYTTPRVYNEHHRDLLSAIASQTAIAIQNARLFEEARTRAEELAALNDLSRVLSTHLDVSQVLDQVYRGVSRLLDTTNFYIALYDPDRHEVSFPINVSESELDQQITVLPADQGLTGYILRTRESLLIRENVAEWLDQHGMTSVGEPAQSWLGVPMMLGDQILGVMAIQDYKRPNLYDERDRDVLAAIASQTAIAIQNARLFEQTSAARQQAEARVREMQILHRVIQAMSSSLELEQVLDALFGVLSQEMGFPYLALSLIDEPADQVRTLRATGLARGMNGLVRPLSQMQHDILIDVARKGQIEVIDGWDDRFDRAIYEREGHAALVRAYVPLKLQEKPIGILEVGYLRQERPAITPEEVRLLDSLASQTAVAIQNARLFQETRRAEETLRQQNEYLTALQETTVGLMGRLDLDSLLQAIVSRAATLVGTAHGYIYLADPGETEMQVRVGVGSFSRDIGFRIKPGEGLSGRVWQTGRPLAINDYATWQSHVAGARYNWVHAIVGVPLMSGSQVVGVIGLAYDEPGRAFGDDSIELLNRFAQLASLALENARLFEQTQASLTEARALYETSRQIEAAQDPQEMITALAEGLRVPGITWAALLMYERDTAGEIQAVQVQGNWYDGQDIAPMPIGTRLSKDMFAAMGVVLSTTPLFMDDTRTDSRIATTTADALRRRNIRTLGILPLTARGTQFGVLMLAGKTAHHFTEREVQACSTLVGQIAVILENRRLLRETEARARREQLLREITSRVRSSTDPDMIVRTAVRELGTALGRTAFIRLGSAEQLMQAPAAQSADGEGKPPIHTSSDSQAPRR